MKRAPIETALSARASGFLLKDAGADELLHAVRVVADSDIARELVVGDATVKTHVARIFAKLNLHDRAQAVVLAYESGLVQPGAAAST